MLGRQPQRRRQSFVPVHLERPHERRQQQAARRSGRVDRVQVATPPVDHGEVDHPDVAGDRVLEGHRRGRVAVAPGSSERGGGTTHLGLPETGCAGEAEPVDEQVEPGTRPELQQPDALGARGRHHVEQPGQQGHRPADLVGLRRHLQRRPQLARVGGDHLPQHRPGLGGVVPSTQTWVEPGQLRSLVGQHQPEHAGQHPQRQRRAGRRRLVPRADGSDRSARLPVRGHAAHRVAVQVRGLAAVAAEAVGQGAAVVPADHQSNPRGLGPRAPTLGRCPQTRIRPHSPPGNLRPAPSGGSRRPADGTLGRAPARPGEPARARARSRPPRPASAAAVRTAGSRRWSGCTIPTGAAGC